MSVSLKDIIGFEKQVVYSEPDPTMPLHNQFIGVEVEVEGAAQTTTTSPLWNSKRDGSLRDGGKEFVFSRPLFNSEIKEALDNLQEAFNKYPPTISERCSVHVHINVSDISTVELHRLLMLYLIFERTLVRYHKDREDNIFAVPFYKAPMYLSAIDALYKEDFDGIHNIFRTMNKYQALNLLTVREFGSIEFRHMGGTANMEDIYEWVKIILYLKRYALENDFDPIDLLHGVSGRGPENFLDEVFEGMADKLRYQGVEADIMKGIRLAQLSTIKADLDEVDGAYGRRRFNPEVSDWIDGFLLKDVVIDEAPIDDVDDPDLPDPFDPQMILGMNGRVEHRPVRHRIVPYINEDGNVQTRLEAIEE